MLPGKITLPDSTHPIIISKNPGFRALYLVRRNELRFFCLINSKYVFPFFGCWLCPKNLAFARKIMSLCLCQSLGAAAPPNPLARTPMDVGIWVGFVLGTSASADQVE